MFIDVLSCKLCRVSVRMFAKKKNSIATFLSCKYIFHVCFLYMSSLTIVFQFLIILIFFCEVLYTQLSMLEYREN